jgi:hypothetical protein
MNLKEKLLKLEGLIRENKPQLLNAMYDGLSGHIIIEKLTFLDFDVPDDAVTLYEWKNGTNEDSKDADELFIDGYFLNIDSSIEMCKIELKVEWNNEFFPLFNGYGDVLTLIGVKKDSINFNKIFFYDPTSGGTNAVYGKCLIEYCDSLESLIDSVIECYERGVYKIDSESREMIIDWDLYREIFNKNNPNAEYWNNSGEDD